MGLPDLPEQADEDQTFSIGEGNVINMDFTSDDSEYESDFLNLDVWNAPRPTELNIELDGAKANQIVNVMAGFELPNSSVPAWAVGIPEDKWKQELLQRIRQRQHSEDIQKSNN
ncbi:uncharacterized protein LOC128743126 isoform X2 [Sabethes cyaneus]|uniref:uncharacterized protein LOC128743126 isoform X2 n=1 Tax=Sabethes cyaneus TaxID=53552 RepID=UPI00237E1B02|nr:uncharacterized protein LOC128743126 isoform X2 [Sabethes cyaneus]